MGALSHSQFAEHVNAGGASRQLHTREDVPKIPGMYAVSDAGKNIPRPYPVTGRQVRDHRSRLLKNEGTQVDPRAMQGGWTQNTAAGKDVYLDLSRLVEGRREAVAAGRRNAQVAVYSHDRAIAGRRDTEVYMQRPQTNWPNGIVNGSHDDGYTVDSVPMRRNPDARPTRAKGKRRIVEDMQLRVR